MLLTRLGIPRLWGEDPERLWPAMRGFVAPVVGLLAPSHAYGADRVPRSGGFVLAANHLSAIDPPLVGAFCPRALHYMAKAELLARPLVGEALTWTGAFPVRRGEGDREALRRARELVRAGRAVCFFVEGTRQRLGYPGPVLPGGMMIAAQEGAPVVPCGLYTFGWTLGNRRRCAAVFGEPMTFGAIPRSGRGYKEAAGLLGAEIVRLWRLAAAAVATGFPPELDDGSRRSGIVRPWRHVYAAPEPARHDAAAARIAA